MISGDNSDCVYHFCEGHDATQHAAFGEAAHIAVTLRMHEESSYEGLDLIECEVRRRTFWLLFGGKLFASRHATHIHVMGQRTSRCRYYWDGPYAYETRTRRVISHASSTTNSKW